MERNRSRKGGNGGSRKRKQWLAAWLILVLLAQTLTGVSYGAPAGGGRDAGYTAGLCAHHTAHTEECGYQEAHGCSHGHAQECYEKFDEEEDGTIRDTDESGDQTNSRRSAGEKQATPSDATPSDATPSAIRPENCVHIHDLECGYAEARACTYHCRICAGEELTLEEQAKAMEAQMKAETGAQAETQAWGYRSARTAAESPALPPFVIGSEAILRELAEKVNGGETWANGDISYAECTYVLTADISLASAWIPVGTEEHPFTGTFDGDGFVIRGVETDGQGPENRGLFGYIKGGTVEDLGIVAADIRGGKIAGAVAGTVDGGAVRRCYSTGYVAAADVYPASGGIVGYLAEDGSVIDCYSTANAEGNSAGGIVANLEDSKIKNCYSTGNINSMSVPKSTANAGGLIGCIWWSRNVNLTNSVALNPAVDADADSNSAQRVLSGLLEWDPSGDITVRDNYAFSGMKANGSIIYNGTHDNNNGANLSYDPASKTFTKPWEDIFDDMSAWDTEQGKLPTLKGIGGQDGEIPEWIVNGTTADLYIGSESELKAFQDRVNGTDGKTADSFAGKTVVLTADINLDSSEEWTPIGFYDDDNPSAQFSFKGTFDGGGHTISGVSVRAKDTEMGGLFGRIEDGTIKNLGVKDADIRGGRYSGVVAGSLFEGIIQNCYSTGRVREAAYAGGIVGLNNGMYVRPDFRGSVNDCYSAADVEGKDRGNIGGIAGACTTSEIKRCYSTGVVNVPSGNVGGVAGYLQDAGISHCAALNPSVTYQGRGNGRVVGIERSGGHIGEDFLKNNYAFSGMKVNGNTVTGGEQDNENGADLTFNPDRKEFSTPWETIFDNASAWDIRPGRLPILKGLGGQDGTIPEWIWEREKASLLIGSKAELIAFRNMVNGTNGMTADDFAGKTVRLTADIRLTEQWTPIGVYTGSFNASDRRSFKGVFDGDGYIISGLYIHDEEMDGAGLFQYIDGGTVKNLGLKEVEIKARSAAGAVAGYLKNGAVQNCFSEGNIVAALGNTGGIIGSAFNGLEIKNCYSRGSAAGIGNVPVGGIVGLFGAEEIHLEHCYSAGSVTGSLRSGGLIGSVVSPLNNPVASGTIRGNASLLHSLEGNPDFSGRIAGFIGEAPQTVVNLEENYAFSGMKVNGAPAEGDNGSGRSGMDGSLKELVMDRTIFPASDWVLTEGCYPVLKVFADRGEEPVPLEYWLVEQTEGRFGIEVETPASYTFPEAAEGYGRQAAKTVTVANTGKEATGELTVMFTEQKKDGAAKPAGTGDYFTLAKATGGAAPGNIIDSIAPGGTGSFAVSPAAGLKEGTYTGRLRIAGKYGLSADYEVCFTVRPEGGSDGSPDGSSDDSSDDSSDTAHGKPEHTILTGDIPSSVGTGVWVQQPDGGWKFYKKPATDTTDGAAGSETSAGTAGGPGVTGGYGAGSFAAKEWLFIDGFWYLFDENGRMVTGWLYDPDTGFWYWLDGNGAMAAGWLCDPDTGFWYWLDGNGAMVTGWREIEGKWYYFNPDSDGTRGKLLEDETAVDRGRT